MDLKIMGNGNAVEASNSKISVYSSSRNSLCLSNFCVQQFMQFSLFI